MSSKPHGGDGHQIPEGLRNRTSPFTVLTPVVMDGVSEIATKLSEINGIVESLDIVASSDTPRAPGTGELLRKIAEVHKDVGGVKRDQDTQLTEIKDKVKNGLKTQIAEALEDEIGVLVAGSVADHVEREMAEWGREPGVTRLLSGLQGILTTNNLILEGAQIQLENSCSRHENSVIDIQADFSAVLKPIKRKDGVTSELFPASLRALFSYDAVQLALLLEEYDLRPFENHGENLNRFLTFIGINASIPYQLVDILEEQPPVYPLEGSTGLQGEGTQGAAR